jgi:flagellar biosynthetic protein FliR
LFALSFSLAAPVVFCILLVEMSLGVLARNLPQMNMLAMGIPVKIIIGMVALSLWFTGIGNVMLRAYAGIYQAWDLIFIARAGAH